ncbi:cytochrome b561 and DOMON domain-containing protein At5g48750-like [Phalaenopsis equestris]|uniref:cytochrome b561 and DOMON domain-containing protein At5g48750-like n=1 Tax=Phalaenopsis equestris TaxID=78828 RepID=UPI0009E195CF|nr:cytochrome b561 and DOMON domain-containing protein At5g48750-like [Phalaenopsis equestris]
MHPSLLPTILFLLLSFLPSLFAATDSCSSYTFSTDESFDSCIDLPYLNAALHWTYAPKPGTLRAAFRASHASDGWVAWGINPIASKMIGTQALVAFRHSNGSLIAYPTSIDSYAPDMSPGELALPVYNLQADYVDEEMIIYVTLGVWNSSDVNHVWQVGSNVVKDRPQKHKIFGENLKSVGTISFI